MTRESQRQHSAGEGGEALSDRHFAFGNQWAQVEIPVATYRFGVPTVGTRGDSDHSEVA